MSLSPPSPLPASSLERLSSQSLTEDAAFVALRGTWQPVANAADLPPGKTMGYTLLDTELVVSRFAEGRLLAADTACPDKGARLTAERVPMQMPSPNLRERCTVFWSLAISPGFRGRPPKQQIEFTVRVLEEDRQMCELRVPREVPLNPTPGGWGVLVMLGDTLTTIFHEQFRRWRLAGANP